MVRQENTRLVQQVEVLLSMQQRTQQHLTQAQQLLHDMQQRYDRLLDAPRPTSPAQASRSSQRTTTPAGALLVPWQRILGYLREQAQPMSPLEVQQALGCSPVPGIRWRACVRRGCSGACSRGSMWW
jgi:hypothetical protein